MVLRQPKNVGTVQNINTAYRHAVGDYYINLSCGDVFFEKQTISKIASRMISKETKMMITSRLLYAGNFAFLGLVPHYSERKKLYKMASREDQCREFFKTRMYGMASGSVLCSSKAIMEEMGFFDERYILLEDGPLLAKYLKKYEVDYYPEMISIWYEQGGVSTGGIKELSPVLQRDTMLFYENEGIGVHHPPPTMYEERKKEFMKARREAETGCQKILCYVKYPFQAVSFLVEKCKDRILRITDRPAIKRAMADRIPAVDGC